MRDRCTAALVSIFAIVYAAVGLVRHWAFESSYDLAIFDQAIWHVSRFESPASSVRGYANLFGDHFSPVLVLLAPLYWIAPRPETLIVAQAVLLALSIVPVAAYARERLPSRAALLLTIAYGLFWGLQRAAAFDFHEIAFAPLAVATLILARHRRRWGWFAAAIAALVCTKEDLIPLVVFVGLYLIVAGERRAGAIVAASALAAFALIVGVVIPALGAGQYGYQSTFSEAIGRPLRIPLLLVWPPVKLTTAFMWVAPFALLPLASPLCTWLLPFAAERFLSASPTHWGTIFHYSAAVAPVAAMAAIDGLARVSTRIASAIVRRRTMLGFAAASVVLSAFLPGHQPMWDLFQTPFREAAAMRTTAFEALAAIPPGAPVVAQAAIAPRLAHREAIAILTADAPDAEWVIASAWLSPWPARSVEELAAWLRRYRERGYTVVFDRGGWIVLHQRV
ncbi:MAG TPA: DUF2079 domain-containing protein [Vicinamibacterales bacterium]|nr:DUF2079 domain-containing protein [Vicinamibacterales bacterium]